MWTVLSRLFGNLQELRGRFQTRCLSGQLAAGRAEDSIFFHNHVVEKEKRTVIYRTYAVHIQTDRLLSITAYCACGSMVRDLSCSGNVGSKSQHFLNKIWVLPPCRRRNCLSGQRPRNSCNLQELRGFPRTKLFASGRAEDAILIHKHIARNATCL